MAKANNWGQLDQQYVWHSFAPEGTAPNPIEIASAQGLKLIATNGREYLDLISSWWVNIHGHAHPAIAKAIAEQALKLEQVMFTDFTHEPAVKLAGELLKYLPNGLQRVFYTDNGSAAVEVALKMALQYWSNQGQTRTRFAAFQGAYHGDTVGAVSVGRGEDALPYPATWDNDAEVESKEAAALQAIDEYLAKYNTELAGIIIEPLVQGAAGMRMCRPQFLRQLAERTQAANVLLIFDEAMTGFGRTGQLFASLTANVTPDIICLAKGLTAGFLPLAATICSEKIYQSFSSNKPEHALVHRHAFTANPLGCAAAIASLQLFERKKILDKLPHIAQWHQREIQRFANHPKVECLRVQGTIAALNIKGEDLSEPVLIAAKLKAFFYEKGMLLHPIGNVVYLLPPYCINESEMVRAYDAIEEALTTIW